LKGWNDFKDDDKIELIAQALPNMKQLTAIAIDGAFEDGRKKRKKIRALSFHEVVFLKCLVQCCADYGFREAGTRVLINSIITCPQITAIVLRGVIPSLFL
jgi:hypothetical protein